MRRLTDADCRRLRWLARVLAALDVAPEAHRRSVQAVADRLATPGLSPADTDATLATLGSLVFDTFEHLSEIELARSLAELENSRND